MTTAMQIAGVILNSDSHGASGRGGDAERTTLRATARRIMEARGTPLILGMTVMGIVSIGCVAVGCGSGFFKRPVFCRPFVLVLDL
jgi:hypothetical protein